MTKKSIKNFRYRVWYVALITVVVMLFSSLSTFIYSVYAATYSQTSFSDVKLFRSLYVQDGLTRVWDPFDDCINTVNWGAGDIYYWEDAINEDGMYCGTSLFDAEKRAYVLKSGQKMSYVNNNSFDEAHSKYGYNGQGTDVTIQMAYESTGDTGSMVWYKGVQTVSSCDAYGVNQLTILANGWDNTYSTTTDSRVVGSYPDLKIQDYTFSVETFNDNLSEMDVKAYISCDKVLDSTAPYNEQVNMEFLLNGNADVYTIRIYNKILNEDEIKQNHFIDLIAINNISTDALKLFASLDNGLKNTLYNNYKNVSISEVTKDDLETSIYQTASLGKVVITEDMIDDYRSLYVDNGLIRDWDTFTTDVEVTDWGNYWKDFKTNDGLYCGSSVYDEEIGGVALNGSSKLSLVNNNDPEEAERKYGYSGVNSDLTIQVNANVKGEGTIISYKGITASVDTDALGIKAYHIDGITGLDYVSTNNNKIIGNFANLSYLTQTFVVDTSADNMQFSAFLSGEKVLSQTLNKNDNVNLEFFLNGNADVRNVRIYNRALTQEEILQNNFADLVNDVKIDASILEKLINLPATKKTELYVRFANKTAKDVTSTILENAINEVIAKTYGKNLINDNYIENVINLTDGVTSINVSALSIINFKGYQARKTDYIALRGLFEIDENVIKEIESLGYTVEYGASMGLASNENTTTTLTLSKNANGEFVISNSHAINVSVYKTSVGKYNEFLSIEEDKSQFGLALTFKNDSEKTDEYFNKECVFCGYVIISKGKDSTVLYADMHDGTFGSKVSIKEASRYALYNGEYTSLPIIEVCGENEVLASKTVDNETISGINTKLSKIDEDLRVLEEYAIKLSANKNAIDNLYNNLGNTNEDKINNAGSIVSLSFDSTLLYDDAIALINQIDNEIAVVDDLVSATWKSFSSTLLSEGVSESEVIEIMQAENVYVGNYKDRIEIVKSALKAAEDVKAFSNVKNKQTKNIAMTLTSSFNNMSLNGIDIKNYVIIANHEDLEIAKNLQNAITRLYGITLPVTDNEDKQFDYEILIGNTNRAESILTITSGFDVKYLNNKLVINSVSNSDLHLAVESFIDSYLTHSVVVVGERNGLTLSQMLDLGLPKVYGALNDKEYTFDNYDSDALWELFLCAKAELPDEIRIIERIEETLFPKSMEHVFFISPNGNDANSGTIDSPLASITEALNRVRIYDGGVIYLRGGQYTYSNVQQYYSGTYIEAQDSGTDEAPLIISAYNGEEVTLSASGIDVNSNQFTPVSSSTDSRVISARNRLESSAQGKVYYIDLGALGYTRANVGENTTQDVPNLYVGDDMQTLARWPNKSLNNAGANILGNVLWTGSVIPMSEHLYNPDLEEEYAKRPGWEVSYKDGCYDGGLADRVARWNLSGNVADKDIWVAGNLYMEWHKGRYHIINIDTEQGSFTSENSCGWGAYHYFRNKTYVYNVLEELDEAGEWYIDRNDMILYYYPTVENFNTTNKTISLTSKDVTIMQPQNVSNLILKDLTFTKTRGRGLYMINCQNVLIENCKITDTSLFAIDMKGCKNCSIIYSEFSGCDSTSIKIYNNEESRRYLTPTNNLVQNCYFHDNRPASMYVFEMTEEVGSVFAHNVVEGAVLGGTNNECIYEYNDISGGVYESIEGAGIYVGNGSKKSSRGNHYRYNYFHDFNTGTWAMGFDDMSASEYVYGNVVDATRGSIEFGISGNNAREMVVSNNIFIGTKYSMEEGWAYAVGGAQSVRWPLYVNMLKDDFDNNISKEVFFERYPLYALYSEAINEAYEMMYGSGATGTFPYPDGGDEFARNPMYMTYKNNVTINCENQLKTYNRVSRFTSFAETNKDYKTTDVGFVDYNSQDYSLKYDSPIFNDIKDFYDIPFYRIGIVE